MGCVKERNRKDPSSLSLPLVFLLPLEMSNVFPISSTPNTTPHSLLDPALDEFHDQTEQDLRNYPQAVNMARQCAVGLTGFGHLGVPRPISEV